MKGMTVQHGLKNRGSLMGGPLMNTNQREGDLENCKMGVKKKKRMLHKMKSPVQLMWTLYVFPVSPGNGRAKSYVNCTELKKSSKAIFILTALPENNGIHENLFCHVMQIQSGNIMWPQGSFNV
jgi:hypothetical protein